MLWCAVVECNSMPCNAMYVCEYVRIYLYIHLPGEFTFFSSRGEALLPKRVQCHFSDTLQLFGIHEVCSTPELPMAPWGTSSWAAWLRQLRGWHRPDTGADRLFTRGGSSNWMVWMLGNHGQIMQHHIGNGWRYPQNSANSSNFGHRHSQHIYLYIDLLDIYRICMCVYMYIFMHERCGDRSSYPFCLFLGREQQGYHGFFDRQPKRISPVWLFPVQADWVDWKVERH